MARSSLFLISDENRYLLQLSVIGAAVFLLDQFSKFLVLKSLSAGEPITVWGDFLRLTLAYNIGGAFSTKLGSGTFYIIAAILVIGLIVWYLYREAGKDRWLDLALAIVLGGALANLFDRFKFGKVIDWIDVDFFDINIASGSLFSLDYSGYHMTRWPIFNIADAAVTCGMIMILFGFFCGRRRNK